MMYDVTVVDVPHCNVQLRVVAHAPGPPRRTPCCARTGFGVDEISLPSEGPSACRPPFFPHTPLVFEGITSRAGRRMEHGSTTTAPQDGTRSGGDTYSFRINMQAVIWRFPQVHSAAIMPRGNSNHAARPPEKPLPTARPGVAASPAHPQRS